MSQYQIDAVDPAIRNSAPSLELILIGSDRRVLDVGCSTGYLGQALAAQGCLVTGVEYEPEAAQMARSHLAEVVEADLNVTALADLFAGREFDVVVLGDILEHLLDPDSVLRSAVSLLAAGGAVVISIPNVAHGSLRLALLQGRWDYRETGLLDHTHLRFFTRESVLRLVADAGLHITDLRGTVLDPLGCEVEIDDQSLPGTIVEWVRSQPDALTYQFVFRAEVGPGDGQTIPDLLPAVVLPPPDDLHTARALEGLAVADDSERRRLTDELIALRRHILTLRDHAVGAEAELGHARRERARLAGELEAAEHDTEMVRRDIDELRRSTSWRVGQVVVAPMSGARQKWRGRA